MILTSLILMLTIFTSVTLAQSSATVTGAVIDSNSGEPLAGVNIILAGTNTGTSTDVNGTYSLKVPEGEHSISASFVGFKSVTKEITAEPGQFYSVDFELEPGAELGAVQVIGTRNVNRSVAETTVPVDIISLPQTFASSPQTDLNQLLTYVAPSFQANRQSSADATEFVDPASFRGLGPDQILVLINGKRRHNTSLVNNIGTFGNGSVGTDLNAIPYSAIDRIEILRDGAAAQYGSDAVAGVINIVLKTDTEELTGDVTYGSMSRGDGETIQYSANYGFKIGERGFVNMPANLPIVSEPIVQMVTALLFLTNPNSETSLLTHLRMILKHHVLLMMQSLPEEGSTGTILISASVIQNSRMAVFL